MTVKGITHHEFCDAPFFSPLRRGFTNRMTTVHIVRKYLLAFFNRHLRNIEQQLLDGPPSRIEKVDFQVWEAGAASVRRKHLI